MSVAVCVMTMPSKPPAAHAAWERHGKLPGSASGVEGLSALRGRYVLSQQRPLRGAQGPEPAAALVMLLPGFLPDLRQRVAPLTFV